ncbi:uncharacterized protein LOC135332299 [Halichondria panicea]|uniref:uncharacterized protein LOC135332299 n=1 Tax=Halichondria panicea TaxID=6063 RepID=UPI00312B90E3
MLRWLLGGRVGGEDRVREIIVSQDRSRAIVEFVNPDPGVIQQLVSTSADLLDPLSKQPLRLTQIDLTTLCLVVTGFPPFVYESALESHFRREADGQQIHSVQMSADKESAMITFMCPTFAMELAGKKTQLFGFNLHLELGCNSTTNSSPAYPTSTAVHSSIALCVQGLPETMLNNLHILSEALKYFIKQGTGFEAADCSIVQGLGYLTFTDPSAVQAIVNNPPTQNFMFDSILHMSATSQPLAPSQVPPTAPREAWGVHDTPIDRQLPGNTSPHLERPPVRPTNRPPVPHRRRFASEGIDGPSPSNRRQHIHPRNQPQWHYQGDQYPHHQGPQQHQSYYGPMHHSASYPDSMGTTTPTSYGQQLPYPPYGYPPYSGQPQWGGQDATIAVQSGAPQVRVQGSQHGPQKVAHHHPPANAMATAPTGLCRKVKVNDLPKEARNQTVLKLYIQSLAGLGSSVASVEMFNPFLAIREIWNRSVFRSIN